MYKGWAPEQLTRATLTTPFVNKIIRFNAALFNCIDLWELILYYLWQAISLNFNFKFLTFGNEYKP